ncbi:MAG: HAD-IC family P-type ATPase [Chloroflexota bacterium]
MSITSQPISKNQAAITGLTAQEVRERIARGQVNRFKARSGRTYLQIIQQNLFNIFNLLLFTMLLIVLISGDFWTVLFAGFSVVTNSLIGTIQEINAKRKLDELANLAPKEVHVVRDGQVMTIDHQEVVLDDVIYIQPGDRLVVDGQVIASDSMEIDESHLTGESDPVYKSSEDAIVSGSFCVAGTGYMVATRIGAESTVNRLTSIAKVYKTALTPTQKKIAAIVRLALVVLFIFGPMSFISGWVSDIGFINIIKNTVVFTTSLVPQGLILTSILALTIGAVKISRHRTLIQRVNAVESMANVTVLCFDKTGTLTENHLVVSEIVPLSGQDIRKIEDSLRVYISNLAHKNTTAAAIAEHVQPDSNADYPVKEREIPFTSGRKWGAILLRDQIYVMGAPERLLAPGHPTMQHVSRFANQGMRVLAFAQTTLPPLADRPLDPETLTPVALVVIRDQVRADIKQTLDSFIAQEVRPKVISGDNIETVVAVAQQAGMDTSRAYTGPELDAMNDTDLAVAVRQADVFARVEPETKRRIIAALRAQSQYVAMVGDGVNDVPALKEADLAIVMNDGAQISKDVADIVLLNNAMSTLPRAFEEGTKITQTLYGTTKIFVTKNVYNTSLFIFILFMALPFPVTPIQISWAAFGTVNVPSGLMAFGLLRPARISSFRRDVLDYIITSGLTASVGMAVGFTVAYTYTDQNLYLARSATTIFFILYGLTIFWYVCGVDITQPSTYMKYPTATLITGALTGATLLTATLLPDVFEFAWPPLEVVLLIVLLWLLVSLIVSVGMRNRALLHQVYTLFEANGSADRDKQFTRDLKPFNHNGHGPE